MDLDPDVLPARDIYRSMIALVTPRPIAWVSTISARGIPNLAPFSFFTAVGVNPPTLVFSCANKRDGALKDTVRNLEAVPEMVVHVVSHDLRDAVNLTSAELDYEVNEFERAGLSAAASARVRPPRVAAARAYFECVVHQVVRVGEGPLAANLIIARVVFMHVDDDALDARGVADPDKLDTIGRMGGDLYVRTTDRFALGRPPTAAPPPPSRPPEPLG